MKYRIKTKEEFIKEYGVNWRTSSGYYNDVLLCCFNGEMYKYLGIEISKKDYDNIIKYEIANIYGSWFFNINMITEVKSNIPDYKPRKLIKNEA